jgi:DNA-binding transcriptional LysR family regulator
VKQLDLDVLRTFVTIIDTGGYSKAGEILGKAQPTVSLQIKKLEGQIGRKLFTKQGQKHLVNGDGKIIYDYATRMLSLNDQAIEHFSATGLEGRIRLGIPGEFAIRLLPTIIGDFKQRYPDVTLDVHSALSRHLLTESIYQDFDLILALVSDQIPYQGELLIEDELIWAGQAKQSMDPDRLSLVLAPDGCIYRSKVLSTLERNKLSWRITYTNTDLYGLIAAIEQGLGITALARSSCPPELQQIRQKGLPKLGKIKICLFKPAIRYSKASEFLGQFIRNRLGLAARESV